MGCGCGSKKVRVNIKNHKLRKVCPKCRILMGYKQVYSPKTKKHVRKWECPRCKRTEILKKS